MRNTDNMTVPCFLLGSSAGFDKRIGYEMRLVTSSIVDGKGESSSGLGTSKGSSDPPPVRLLTTIGKGSPPLVDLNQQRESSSDRD